MKKVLFSFAVAAVAAVMVSCGNKSAQTAEAQEAEATDQAAEAPAEEATEADPNTYEMEFFTYKMTETFKESSKPSYGKVYIKTQHQPNINISIAGSKKGDIASWSKEQENDKMTADKDVTANGKTYKTFYKEGSAGYVLRAAAEIGLEGEKAGEAGWISLQVQGPLKEENRKDIAFERLQEVLDNITLKTKL